MGFSKSERFERLDLWRSGAGSKPIGVIQKWRRALSIALTPSRFKNPESWRSDPLFWKAYRRLAFERFYTIENHERLNKISDPFWLGNELMVIGSSGIMPVRRACEALAQAHCPADYAPEKEMPTVREILLDWAEWFDTDYNVDVNFSTGCLTRRASVLANGALAEMEASSLTQVTAGGARAASPARSRL